MGRPSNNKILDAAKIVIIGVFFVALFLPLAGTLFHIGGFISLNEKRKLSKLPALVPTFESITGFPKEFENYLNDHFAFRDILIYCNSYVKIHLLSTSPTVKVVLGKQGWLYYAGDNVSHVAALSAPLTQDQLMRIKLYLEIKRDWLAEKGIQYLFVIAPDKQSVYPEYLPDEYIRLGNRLDQLKEYLRTNSDIRVLDLSGPLLKAKKDHPVYYKTDTHWNGYGSFIAYLEIMKCLQGSFPSLRSLSLSDFKLVEKSVASKDLSNMLAMGELFRETVPWLERLTPSQVHPVKLSYELPETARINNIDFFATERSSNGGIPLPRAVVLGDSFGEALVPYLSEGFKRAVFVHIWDAPPSIHMKVIERERPDIIIEEAAERLLDTLSVMPMPTEFSHAYNRKLIAGTPKSVALP